VRYSLERRDPEFDAKMVEVLCVCREVESLKQSAVAREGEAPAVAILSYDEKPGTRSLGCRRLERQRRTCRLPLRGTSAGGAIMNCSSWNLI
jgi:hypothetical protein